MHALANDHSNIRGGFVHLPIPPEQAPEEDAPAMALNYLVRAIELTVAVAARACARIAAF